MPKKKHPKAANINVRCTPELKAIADAEAEANGLSVTRWLEFLIRKAPGERQAKEQAERTRDWNRRSKEEQLKPAKVATPVPRRASSTGPNVIIEDPTLPEGTTLIEGDNERLSSDVYHTRFPEERAANERYNDRVAQETRDAAPAVRAGQMPDKSA
jgi:hypothetical protein